jgi:hypothetical protein
VLLNIAEIIPRSDLRQSVDPLLENYEFRVLKAKGIQRQHERNTAHIHESNETNISPNLQQLETLIAY